MSIVIGLCLFAGGFLLFATNDNFTHQHWRHRVATVAGYLIATAGLVLAVKGPF